MADKKPWTKWFWSDWKADEALRACGLEARGLWAEMLAIMDKADPYGHLLLNGTPVTARQLMNQAGGGTNEKQVLDLLAELKGAGVYSENEKGVIYCRRMVRDHAKSLENSANGLRGGNPDLLKKHATAKPTDKATVGHSDKSRVGAPLNPPVGHPDKAQKPEARSQKPDQSDPFEFVAARATDGQTLQDLADQIAWDAGKSDEIDRKRVSGWVVDVNLLRGWLAAGHTPERVRNAARSVISRSSDIRNLWALLAKAMPDELAKKPEPTLRDDAELQRKCAQIYFASPLMDESKRVTGWRVKPPERRVWSFDGAPPFERGSLIPNEIAAAVCAELGIQPPTAVPAA